MEVDHGADAENGDEVHVPLQDGQLEEEEEDDDDAADDADVPAAAAGAEDASPGGVLPKLVASDYGTNSPTSKGARRTSITGKGTWFNIKRIKVKSEREVLGANSEGELRKAPSAPCRPAVSPSASTRSATRSSPRAARYWARTRSTRSSCCA